MHTLYAISYSPWSEKARWALDAAGIAYREVAYLPMLGEPALRARLGRWSGRVSVPALFPESGAPATDSYEIARWASERGESLFPRGHEAAVAEWNARSEDALDAGRARTTLLVSRDPDALLENLPPPLRRLGAASRALGRAGVRFLEQKYRFGGASEAALTERLRRVLLELRAGLGGGEYLVARRFTHADIAMATALQVVKPPPHIRVGRRSLPHWTHDALVAEFADLLGWRDELIARHRRLGGR